jgi:hypothetical protein
LFGPGTLVTLAAVAVMVAVGYFKSPPTKALSSNLPSPTAPLSKPEPASLLSRNDLNLSEPQRDKITTLDKTWARTKTELLQAMSAFQPKQGRVDQISSGLSGYTELSRSYDSERTTYWEKAVALLDERQLSRLKGGKP